MNRLKLARKANRLSTRGLAEKVGVSAMAISKYERGVMVPSSDVLLQLARALDVTPQYLLEASSSEITGFEIVHTCLAKYIP